MGTVSNDLAFIRSQKKDLVNVPEEGWQFYNGNDWQEDDYTLTVTGIIYRVFLRS